MTLKEQIMKLQTYKMYEGEDTVYVERDDVLKALEQTDILEKIRSEILENRQWHMEHGQEDCAMLLDLEALAVIDKYKAESEE